MESGTCIFDDWLESTGRMSAERNLHVALDIVSAQAEWAFGTRIWFAQVLGRRLSYIAGLRSERPNRADSAKTALGSGIGLVAESWGELSSGEQDRLKAFLKHLVISRQSLSKWG